MPEETDLIMLLEVLTAGIETKDWNLIMEAKELLERLLLAIEPSEDETWG